MRLGPLLFLACLAAAWTAVTTQDPNLTPIIDELTEAAKRDELCRLFAKLDRARQLTSDESLLVEIDSTLRYINAGLQTRGLDKCQASPEVQNDSLEKGVELISPEPLSVIMDDDGDRDRSAFPASYEVEEKDEEVLQDGDGMSLCNNCAMDYDEPETKKFMETFRQSPESQAEESMSKAKTKLTKFFVFAILGTVASLVAVTLVLFFGIRACARRAGKGKSKKKTKKVLKTLKEAKEEDSTKKAEV